MMIAEQGARAFGGTVTRDPDGGSVHVDHGYDEWQGPVDSPKGPVLFWHSSSTWTWDSSYSGGDGFRNMFLRRGFPVHVIDPPQVGRAGWSSRTFTYEPELGSDQRLFTAFRLGLWIAPGEPEFYPNVQFPKDD